MKNVLDDIILERHVDNLNDFSNCDATVKDYKRLIKHYRTCIKGIKEMIKDDTKGEA